MRILIVATVCALCAAPKLLGQATQPLVAIHDSELTRALESMPATNATPRGAGTTSNEWWTTDSRAGIDVPLGRAGAMKLQHLDLGHGTSQHVLIAGKTGAGKTRPSRTIRVNRPRKWARPHWT